MKNSNSGCTAKSFSSRASGSGDGPKSFKSRAGGGSEGPGGHYDETNIPFRHTYGESEAKAVVHRLHKHTR